MQFTGQCGKILSCPIRHRRQYCSRALHAGYLRLQTHTHSQYVIFIAFPLQHRLHERASMLRYSTLPVLCFGVDSPSVCLVKQFSFTLYFQSNFNYSWLRMLFSDILYKAGQ